jgi:hypothetical protein
MDIGIKQQTHVFIVVFIISDNNTYYHTVATQPINATANS